MDTYGEKELVRPFNYIVSVMIRVNNTFLDKPSDLVDSVPDSELFWIRWFSR
jgi:hypothetical protein